MHSVYCILLHKIGSFDPSIHPTETTDFENTETLDKNNYFGHSQFLIVKHDFH